MLPLQHSPDKPLAICSGLHRLFCSPPYPTAHTDQPNELTPLQAHPSALRSPCSTLWQPSSPLRASFAVPGNHQPFSAVRTLRHEPLPPSFSLRPSRPSPNQWPRQLPSAGHRPRPASPLMRVARPAPPHFSTSAPDPSSSVSRSLSAQLFAVLLTSAHPPPSRIRSAATSEFSRHILAPLPIPLHTQTSRSSSLPFKPVLLLRAPLAAPPGACCHRSVLPSVALSGNHRPLYFHSPSPPSSKSPDRSLSTTVRSPQPRPNFQLSSGTNLAAPFSLCPRPASSLMRVARPAPPHFSTSAPDPSSSVSRSLSAQLFAVLLTSAHPPPSRIRSAATSEFSRHILAPLPIPLHTQTSRSSSLPFKPVLLLRAPLAAPPGACCHRSVLPSVALSGNHRPLYFHSPSPPSSKSPDRSLSTTVRSPQPRPNFQLSSGTNLATPFSLCPRPTFPLMRVARPAPPYFSNTRTEHLFIRPARPRLDISPSS